MSILMSHVNLSVLVLGRSAGGSVPVKGFTGGGIAIFCKFDDRHKGKPKYFCKGDALTCPHNRLTHVNNSRFVQYENVHGDYLTALLTNLTSEDAGTYHCAAEDGHLNTGINLNVKQGNVSNFKIENNDIFSLSKLIYIILKITKNVISNIEIYEIITNLRTLLMFDR